MPGGKNGQVGGPAQNIML